MDDQSLPAEGVNIREGDDANRLLTSVLFNGGAGLWIISARWAERPLDPNPIYEGSGFWPVTGHSEERFDDWEEFKARLDELAEMLDYQLIG